MGTRNKVESAIAKRVNKNLIFNVNSFNTDRPVNPTVDNGKSLSRNNSAENGLKMFFYQLLRIGYKMLRMLQYVH